MNTQWHKFTFIIVLSVCMTVPLTNDIFISGMPAMKKYFVGSDISLVLSTLLLGLAIAQLFYGPLLDRFGRRPVLLAGLILYTLASAVVMTSSSFTLLLVGRFFQAVGICSAITSSLAIARDTYKQEELVRAMSLIMAIMGVGPAAAPLIGSFLNYLWGWRASFEFLFVLGCFYTIWMYFFLEETHLNKNLEALALNKILKNYFTLMKQSKFLRYCIISGFSYGVLFSYINLSPFFIIEKMHFSLISFGAIVAANALPIIITAIFVPKIASKFSVQLITQLGLMFIFIGGVTMWALNGFFTENIYTFVVPIFIIITGIGMIRPTASAGAMQLIQSKVAGSAASFFNLFSFVSGTVAIAISGKLIHHLFSFGIFIALMGAAAILAINMLSIIGTAEKNSFKILLKRKEIYYLRNLILNIFR